MCVCVDEDRAPLCALQCWKWLWLPLPVLSGRIFMPWNEHQKRKRWWEEGSPLRKEIIMLKKTAFLVNLSSVTSLLIVDEKSSNPRFDWAGGGGGGRCQWFAGPAVWKSECSMLTALRSFTLILCFHAPKVFAYANQTTGALEHGNHITSLTWDELTGF